MKYDSIINLPHYEPKYHKRMSKMQRAAQFNPGLPSPMSVKSIPAIVDVRVLSKAQNTREKPVFFCIFSIYYRMESGIMI